MLHINVCNLLVGGAPLIEFMKLRHRVFNEQQRFDMPVWRGMEHDEYDTPAATYLLAVEGKRMLGGLRLVPTKYERYEGSMLANKFSCLVDGDVPSGKNIYEGTRFVVCPNRSPGQQDIVKDHLVVGLMEFALSIHAASVIAMMRALVWSSLFENRGWPVTMLGRPKKIGDADDLRAGQQEVSEVILADIQRETRLYQSLLRIAPGYELTGVGQ